MPDKNFLMTGEAQAITVTTGSISAVSSLLVISIIMRSSSKLSSSYHRIMFSLSCWDTLSSVAIALSTLPMSKDVHEVYAFVGIVLGNAGTCTAQGFAIMAGQTFAILSNVTLNIYYVCTIRYKMTDRTVKKRLFPIMIAISCLIGIPMCGAPLILGLFNPRPYEPYCYMGPYPHQCNWYDQDGIHCIRGNVSRETEELVILAVTVGIIFAFCLLAVSLVLVVMSVFQTEMSVRRIREEQKRANEIENKNELDLNANSIHHLNADVIPNGTGDDRESEELEEGSGSRRIKNRHRRKKRRRRPSFIRDMDELQETRTVLLLALMYIGAFFITWIFTIITMTVWITSPLAGRIVDYGKLICAHSQGFFNALIFIYNKIHIARKSKPSLTFLQALKEVVFSPSKVPEVLLSSLDVVVEDMKQREEDQRIEELIQADLAKDEEEKEKRLQQAGDTASPASIPSNFASLDTPSFEFSNAMSSHGIDKEMEENFKKFGDASPERKFYQLTPTKLLKMKSNTFAAASRAAAVSLEQNSGSRGAGGGTPLSNQPFVSALSFSSPLSKRHQYFSKRRYSISPPNFQSTISSTPHNDNDNDNDNDDAKRTDAANVPTSMTGEGEELSLTVPPNLRRNVPARGTGSDQEHNGAGSVFTLNSLLSGFSSALAPSAGVDSKKSNNDDLSFESKS